MIRKYGIFLDEYGSVACGVYPNGDGMTPDWFVFHALEHTRTGDGVTVCPGISSVAATSGGSIYEEPAMAIPGVADVLQRL